MNYKNLKSYIEAISLSVPQTFEELGLKLNRTPYSVRRTYNFINSLCVSKHPVLKFRKIGDKTGIIKSEKLSSYARLTSKIKRLKTKRIEKPIDLESFEIIEKYHKNKCCKKCKGKLELSRYFNCIKCNFNIRYIPDEYIESGF